jgi:hypothetical protein
LCLCRASDLYQAAFAGLNASDFNFIKMHIWVHYEEFFERFGSVGLIAGYAWEAGVGFMLTGPYQVVSRQRAGLEQRISGRVALASALDMALALYDDPEVQRGLNYTVSLEPARREGDGEGGAGRALRRTEPGGMASSAWTAAVEAAGHDVERWVEATGRPQRPTGLPPAAEEAVSGCRAGGGRGGGGEKGGHTKPASSRSARSCCVPPLQTDP